MDPLATECQGRQVCYRLCKDCFFVLVRVGDWVDVLKKKPLCYGHGQMSVGTL